MLKRFFNPARGFFLVVAIIVAAPLLVAPTVYAAAQAIDYAENGTDEVATFTASDPDAEADDIEWSLGGPDAGAFEIDGGVLTFKESPDFEAPTDGDEDGDSAGNQGKGDNVYKVTVVASGGEQEVAVTVTDVDEPGSVSFDQPQPQATRGLKASFSDDDGEESPSWQWSRGASAEGPWTDIQGAITATRMPTADDVGNYLRATVTYEDKSGEKAISGVTAEPVEPRTLANARPKFSDDIEAITVNENVSGAIGDPILATDDDNDVLLYAIDNDGADDEDNAKFTIGKTTGQLSVKNEDGENFEASWEQLSCPTDDDATDDLVPYTVKIKATDPSGAVGMATVTVNLKDVNESPAFSDASKDQDTLYIDENATSVTSPTLALRTGEEDATDRYAD